MNDVYKLVDEVTNLRKKRGIKQVELRELCDVTAEYISKVENHRRTPSLKKLIDVCNILDVEIKLVKNKKKKQKISERIDSRNIIYSILYILTRRDKPMACVTEVAKYIIKNCCVDNLKLQKLLYYSQGVFMVLHEGNPLFEEAIEAWDYGPVVNCIYHKYKSNGFDRLQIEDSENSNLTQDEMSAIDMVLEYYGEFSGAALINRTHSEEPWKSTYVPNEAHRVIPKDVIYKYFKQNVEIA